MLWILFYIKIFIPRNTCSLAWTHAGLSEEIILEANAVSLIVLSDWLLLFVLCAFGQRSGVLFQAVFRRPCFFSVHAPAQLRPFLLFQANSICRSLWKICTGKSGWNGKTSATFATSASALFISFTARDFSSAFPFFLTLAHRLSTLLLVISWRYLGRLLAIILPFFYYILHPLQKSRKGCIFL